jgi:hypothetical protein
MVTGGIVLFSNKYEELEEKPDYIQPLGKLNEFLAKGHTLYMHNGIGFDDIALKFLGYDGIDKCIIKDTLGFSWYLEPKRLKHGLASYGEDYGVYKPEVEEWEDQPQEVYNHRVLEDTKIQYLVARDQIAAFKKLYGKEDHEPVMAYLNMKMKHISIQEQNGWQLNLDKTQELLTTLEEKLKIQVDDLKSVMPKVPVNVLKTHPAKAYKANGKLSSHGKKWFSLLLREHAPIDTKELVITTGYSEPNPNSPAQIKSWLFDCGWKPLTFEYKRDKETNKERKIPQVNIKNSGGLVDPDIERMIEEHPEMGFDHIRGLGILKHRVGLVSGILSNHIDGWMQAGASGFTNTLRLKHRNLVNIPSERVLYGKEIRECLIAGEGYKLLGADLSSLENRCKNHFQMPFDPEYVKTQQEEGYDPHLQLAVVAGLISQSEMEFYKWKQS